MIDKRELVINKGEEYWEIMRKVPSVKLYCI